MTMRDWEERLNRFIAMTDREVLQDTGKVSHELAKEFAESEFERYRVTQDRLFESDFDRFMLKENFSELEKKLPKKAEKSQSKLKPKNHED